MLTLFHETSGTNKIAANVSEDATSPVCRHRPTITVSVVTHNNSDKICNLLDSVQLYTKKYPVEVYIIDNQSSDHTVALVRERFPWVRVIENDKNVGFGHGHNQVLDLIHSDYHAIVNPDIILMDDAFARLADFFDQNADIVLACPKICNMDGSVQHLPKRNPTFQYLLGGRLEKKADIFRKWRNEYTMADRKIEEVTDIEFCTGCFMFIRTELFKELDGFDPRYFMYFEDADFTREASEYGRTVVYPEVSVFHEWERASAKRLKFFMIQIHSMFRYFLKWSFLR